jgi:hypothetical protein
MHKLILLFSIFLLFSCDQKLNNNENKPGVSSSEILIWHQRDTIFNADNSDFDSIRQIKLNVDFSLESHLEATSDAPIYLFSGKNLIEKSVAGSLKYSFDRETKEEAYLSLDNEVQNLSFGVYSIKDSTLDNPYSRLENIERDSTWVSENIFLILLIMVSLFMVVLKVNYDKRYISILSFNKIFTTRLNEGDQSRVRIMDQDNLVFAGFYAFLTSGLIYFLGFGNNLGILGIEESGIIEFLKILLVVSVGLIGKVLIVAIVSNLYGNNKIPAFYIKEMLNINLFFLMILFFTSFFFFLFIGSIPSFWLSTATYGILISYLVRIILLYFKILKLSSFTNLYLFSYFCTTEIFPFLIGLKYFMR